MKRSSGTRTWAPAAAALALSAVACSGRATSPEPVPTTQGADGSGADGAGAGGTGAAGDDHGQGGQDAVTTTGPGPGEGAEDTTVGGGGAPGDTTVSYGDTTVGAGDGCSTWCDGYPSNQGCDEEDDGVNAGDETAGDSGGTGGAEDTGIGMGDDFPLATEVYELQLGEIPVGEYVQLDGVIVTSPAAPVPGSSRVMFTVQEARGGFYSGITVRAWSTPEIEALEPGDVVSLVGDHQTRYVFAILALESGGLTVTGRANLPETIDIPAEEIEMVSAGGADAKPLESVLIRILEPEVVDPKPCTGEIEIQASVRIDDRFLSANGEALPPGGLDFSAIVGPLLYTYNGFEVAPRTLADFQD